MKGGHSKEFFLNKKKKEMYIPCFVICQRDNSMNKSFYWPRSTNDKSLKIYDR